MAYIYGMATRWHRARKRVFCIWLLDCSTLDTGDTIRVVQPAEVIGQVPWLLHDNKSCGLRMTCDIWRSLWKVARVLAHCNTPRWSWLRWRWRPLYTLCTDIIFVELQNYSTHLQSIVTYATLLHYYTVYIFSHLTSRFTHIHNSHFVFIVMCILVYGN